MTLRGPSDPRAAADAADPKPDGRRLRTVRTRAAIVDALLALVVEGDPTPTGAQIAARAGVALRSIGQHFASREELFAAAAALHAARMKAALPPAAQAVDPAAPLDERLTRFAAARARDLEASIEVRRAATLFVIRSTVAVAALRGPAARRRAEVASVFAAELAARPRAARRALLDALDLVSGGRAWDTMRREQDLSRRAAERQLRALLATLLTRT